MTSKSIQLKSTITKTSQLHWTGMWNELIGGKKSKDRDTDQILKSMSNSSSCLLWAHVCGTKMMFFELPKGWDRYFFIPDNVLCQGICVLKSNPFTFWYFWPKNGQKRLKKHHKRLGLVWSWFGCDPRLTLTCLNKKNGSKSPKRCNWKSQNQAVSVIFYS